MVKYPYVNSIDVYKENVEIWELLYYQQESKVILKVMYLTPSLKRTIPVITAIMIGEARSQSQGNKYYKELKTTPQVNLVSMVK